MFKKLGLLLVSLFLLMAPVSCAAKAFEKEINVVFMYEDELISHDTVTQFKNIKSPTLSEAYIPDGYKFFGWTPLDPNTISATDENFNEKEFKLDEITEVVYISSTPPSHFYEPGNEDKLNNFHQIVFLYVDVETKEEIIELIIELEKLPFVESVGPNSIEHGE